jgi:xanthine dehydrogenase YagR molybdenum-binding subunit
MDLSAARAAPGVLAIVTARNAGKLGKGKLQHRQAAGRARDRPLPPGRRAGGGQDLRAGARRGAAGAHRLHAHARQVRPGREKDSAQMPKPTPFRGPPESKVGDFAGAFAAAPVQFDATYTTPDQSHAMMEPHATIAAWKGDKLTVWTSNQMIDWSVGDLAKTLGIPKEKCAWSRPSSAAASAASCSCAPTPAGRAGRARGAAAGEGGAAAAR